MQTQPHITLTRPDAKRLHELLDQAGGEDGPVNHLLLERLGDELHRAELVDPARAEGLVTLYSRVEFENLETGQRRKVVLVPPEEAEAGTERLSVLTPIGCSLIGLHQGETFAWDDGPRTWRLQVISVKRGP